MEPALYPLSSDFKDPRDNIYRRVPSEEIQWQQRLSERSGNPSPSGISPEFDADMIAEINRRAGESDDLFKMLLADLGITGVQTGLDLAGKAQGVSRMLPIVGTLLGAAQAAKTQSAMINPYGSGEPTGAHIPTDVGENSLGYASFLGGAGPGALVQAGFGGMASEVQNLKAADAEYPEIAKLINAGDYDAAERMVVGNNSRHWHRNKVSNIFSGKIQAVEDERRKKWTSQYGMETNPSKKRSMLEQEVQGRRHYDMAQGFSPWIENAIMGIRMMAADKADEESILRNWTSGMAQFEKDWHGMGSKK